MEGGSSERTVKSSELSITQTFEFPAARLTIRLRLSINRSVHSCSSLENLCHTLLIIRLMSPKSCCFDGRYNVWIECRITFRQFN